MSSLSLAQPGQIIITGAASGIGRAIARRCVTDGWYVIASDIDIRGLDALHDEFRTHATAGQLSCVQADVADPDDAERIVQLLRTGEPRPAALVNNAGIYLGQDLATYDVADITRVINTNLVSAILCTAAFARYCAAHDVHGKIVNMSSVAGREASSDAVYGATKAALIGLTRSSALTLSPRVQANCIAPGLVATPMLDHIPPERLAEYRVRERINVPIVPEDVADTVAFLLSPAARHYTGAVFDLNNGCHFS